MKLLTTLHPGQPFNEFRILGATCTPQRLIPVNKALGRVS